MWIYVDVDPPRYTWPSLDQLFCTFTFRGGYQWKKHPVLQAVTHCKEKGNCDESHKEDRLEIEIKMTMQRRCCCYRPNSKGQKNVGTGLTNQPTLTHLRPCPPHLKMHHRYPFQDCLVDWCNHHLNQMDKHFVQHLTSQMTHTLYAHIILQHDTLL